MRRSRLVVADVVRLPSGAVGNAILVDGGNVAAVGTRDDSAHPGLEEAHYPGAVISTWIDGSEVEVDRSVATWRN